MIMTMKKKGMDIEKPADRLESFLRLCAQRNLSVRTGLMYGDMTLEQFTELQAGKVVKNREVVPVAAREEFAVCVRDYAGRLLGEKAGEDAVRAISTGALLTADHHGALFCSQQIQGDLLFSGLLYSLGYQGDYIPVFSSSQVELGNSTYARGICSSCSRENKLLYPIFGHLQNNQMVCCTPAIDQDRLDRFRRTAIYNEKNEELRSTLSDILSHVYEDKHVLNASRFADQATIAAGNLSRHLFQKSGGPVFACLELEEVIKPLLIRELHKRDSLLWKILYDDRIRKCFIDTRLPDGKPLSSMLFRTMDQKGRKILLDLTQDGNLIRWDKRNNQVVYSADPDKLSALLTQRGIIPGLLVFFLLLVCERGYTWMGGMFQSVYLPEWQQTMYQFCLDADLKEYAEVLRAYDCSGYINGPMFALYRGDGFAAPAGPVEMWMKRPVFSHLKEYMKNTSLYEAHMIGLSEMYYDLVHPDERRDNWYRIITEGLAERCTHNYIE